MTLKIVRKTTISKQASGIDKIYNDSLNQLNKLEESAISILKTIRQKREQKKINDIKNQLFD